MEFRLWASKAATVEITLGSMRIPMMPCAGDWWIVDVKEAGPGTDYALCLDAIQWLSNPRSCWPPPGVYGPSQVLDLGAFPWADEHWQTGLLASAVLYELHVDTFTPAGTF